MKKNNIKWVQIIIYEKQGRSKDVESNNNNNIISINFKSYYHTHEDLIFVLYTNKLFVPTREMRPRELLKSSSSSFGRAGC